MLTVGVPQPVLTLSTRVTCVVNNLLCCCCVCRRRTGKGPGQAQLRRQRSPRKNTNPPGPQRRPRRRQATGPQQCQDLTPLEPGRRSRHWPVLMTMMTTTLALVDSVVDRQPLLGSVHGEPEEASLRVWEGRWEGGRGKLTMMMMMMNLTSRSS